MDKETKTKWLQGIIDKKQIAIQKWEFTRYRFDMDFSKGRNPIAELNYEIKIAQNLIDMCIVLDKI